MDGIQALSSKSTPVAATPPANDDGTAAGVFAALLNMVGARFSSDATLTMDAKLARGDDAATAERAANDAARDERDAAKVKGEKDEDRAAAKPKDAKKRDENDSDENESQAATNEDAADTTTTQATQQAAQQTAAPVVDMTALEAALAATETVAPVIIVQQATGPVETAQTLQNQTQTVAVVAETAAVAQAVEAVVATGPAVKEAVAVEAPAATQKAADTAQNSIKQTAVQTTGPAQSTAAEQSAVVETAEAEVTTTGKQRAQTDTLAQRSAAAQSQSVDLSQKVGPETKAQVQVTVTHNTGPQTATVASVYDIYAGYNNTQSSTANGQVGLADASNALTQNAKTPADAAQAPPVAAPTSPALANQPVSQVAQQGPSSSAVRADLAAPAPASTGNHASFGESSFGSASSSNQSSGAQSTSQTAAAERPMPPAQQVIDQIKVNITRAAKAGLDRVTIQLKPHELGRVDVRLEMSEDHKVRVTVIADNKDTLALLQNDSRSLERALNDAGLRTDSNNLHFSLRSESDAQQAQDGRNGGKNAASNDNGTDDEDEAIAMSYDYTAAARARGGIDTFA